MSFFAIAGVIMGCGGFMSLDMLIKSKSLDTYSVFYLSRKTFVPSKLYFI